MISVATQTTKPSRLQNNLTLGAYAVALLAFLYSVACVSSTVHSISASDPAYLTGRVSLHSNHEKRKSWIVKAVKNLERGWSVPRSRRKVEFNYRAYAKPLTEPVLAAIVAAQGILEGSDTEKVTKVTEKLLDLYVRSRSCFLIGVSSESNKANMESMNLTHFEIVLHQGEMKFDVEPFHAELGSVDSHLHMTAFRLFLPYGLASTDTVSRYGSSYSSIATMCSNAAVRFSEDFKLTLKPRADPYAPTAEMVWIKSEVKI